ncbi:MAG TPA: hypothetical protein VLE72_03390 [Candidatus Saccharimonadales bacterium]|nr:hypothetical protein [Candidatus Saccharimonadales bacterium]
MTVRELIQELSKIDPNEEVRLSIQTEAGFYDDRGSYASGKLRRVNQMFGVVLEGE